MSQTHHVVTIQEVTNDPQTGAPVTSIELLKRVFTGADADELIERVNKAPRKQRKASKAAKA